MAVRHVDVVCIHPGVIMAQSLKSQLSYGMVYVTVTLCISFFCEKEFPKLEWLPLSKFTLSYVAVLNYNSWDGNI